MSQDSIVVPDADIFKNQKAKKYYHRLSKQFYNPKRKMCVFIVMGVSGTVSNKENKS